MTTKNSMKISEKIMQVRGALTDKQASRMLNWLKVAV